MGEPWSVVLCVNQSSPWSVVLANTSMTSFADPRPRRSPQAQLEGGAFGTTKGARRPAAHLNRRATSLVGGAARAFCLLLCRGSWIYGRRLSRQL